jgi:hypothetical protein
MLRVACYLLLYFRILAEYRYVECLYAERRILFVAMLSVLVVSALMLIVLMLRVMAPHQALLASVEYF